MSRRLAWCVLVSSLIAAQVVASTPSSVAYPVNKNACDDDSITWRFTNEFEPWTDWKKNTVENAIELLAGARDYDGVKLVTMTHDQSFGNGADVQLQNRPLNEWGHSECVFTPSIWVNSNYSTGQFYWKVSRHEMFHLAGAEHGGERDSFDGIDFATMATCLPPSTWPTSNAFEQDGHAYQNWLWSDLSEHQLHANIGFEQGTRFWGITDGPVTEHTSGGATGPGWIGWNSPGPSEYVYQTVRLEVGNLSNDVYWRGVANARSGQSNWTTKIRTQLWRRTVDWTGADNGCDYRNGIKNPNGFPNTSAWVLVTETGMDEVGTGWTFKSTPWDTMVGAEGYDVQVRVHGTAIDGGGGHHQVNIDNVRGEGPS